MPPRYAYWTILIDHKPTAFRAREREELLPTVHQLRRKNADVVMKWFARGRLWDSPEAAQIAQRAPTRTIEKRGRSWRPGGEHRDPRDRFKSRVEAQRPPRTGRPWSGAPKNRPPARKSGMTAAEAERRKRQSESSKPPKPADPAMRKPEPPEGN
jgi:hypothetical protein